MNIETKNVKHVSLCEVLVAIGEKEAARNGAAKTIAAANRHGLEIVGGQPRGNGVQFFVTRESAARVLRAYEEANAAKAVKESLGREKKPIQGEVTADRVFNALFDMNFFVESNWRALKTVAKELGIDLCACGEKLPPEGVECQNCGGRWES